MKRYFTLANVMQRLIAETDLEGGIRPWAEARGLHPSIVDKFIAGQRGPAPQLLAAMGLRKVAVYETINPRNRT